MYDIIGRVKENLPPDSGTSEQDLASKFCNFFVDKITNITSEQDLASKFCNFFVDKITNIRDRLKDNIRFVVQK